MERKSDPPQSSELPLVERNRLSGEISILFFPKGSGEGSWSKFHVIDAAHHKSSEVPGPMVAPSALLRVTLLSPPEVRASCGPAPSQTVAISHMWPLSTWNVASPN